MVHVYAIAMYPKDPRQMEEQHKGNIYSFKLKSFICFGRCSKQWEWKLKTTKSGPSFVPYSGWSLENPGKDGQISQLGMPLDSSFDVPTHGEFIVCIYIYLWKTIALDQIDEHKGDICPQHWEKHAVTSGQGIPFPPPYPGLSMRDTNNRWKHNQHRKVASFFFKIDDFLIFTYHL